MDLEKRVTEIEKELAALKERNKRVAADKVWEQSYLRRLLLFVFTYLAISVYMWAVALPDPWLNALVPSVAFVLSTLGLGWMRGKLN